MTPVLIRSKAAIKLISIIGFKASFENMSPLDLY